MVETLASPAMMALRRFMLVIYNSSQTDYKLIPQQLFSPDAS